MFSLFLFFFFLSPSLSLWTFNKVYFCYFRSFFSSNIQRNFRLFFIFSRFLFSIQRNALQSPLKKFVEIKHVHTLTEYYPKNWLLFESFNSSKYEISSWRSFKCSNSVQFNFTRSRVCVLSELMPVHWQALKSGKTNNYWCALRLMCYCYCYCCCW